MFRLFVAAVFLGTTLLAGGEPDEAAITSLYARGLAGDQQAVIDCIAALEQVLAQRPNDQLARVYLGSAETLRSRDLSFFGTAKLAALRRGIALMDEAAAAAPNDARVLLLRAVTNEAFPKVLGRASLARSSLEALVGQVERDPSRLKISDRQLLYLNAGEAAQRAGDPARAAELWRRGAALRGDAHLQDELNQALAGKN